MLVVPLLLLVLVLLGCESDPPAEQQTPEEVLKTYQGLVDKNQLEEAKALSTPAGKEWLNELAEIIASEQPDSTIFQTKFLSVNCQGQGDTLFCQCLLEDQYERYKSDYTLVKIEEQWLVDAPQDELQIDDDVLENIPDSVIEQILEEELMQ
jgi:hypothetical protein